MPSNLPLQVLFIAKKLVVMIHSALLGYSMILHLVHSLIVLRYHVIGSQFTFQGSPCCYLKEIIPAQNPHQGLTSGIVYHNMYNHPPSGMRSAVPLGIVYFIYLFITPGGLGTGSFEIRADGSFHEFTISNPLYLFINAQ